MKISQSISRILLAGSLNLLAAVPVRAAGVTWNTPAGGNWSVATNWVGGTGSSGLPGPSDDVTFGDVLAGNSTMDDTNLTIDSLSYAQDNNDQQTTTIAQGVTLQINDSGSPTVLSVGSTSASTTASTLVPVIINGAGTLNLSGTGLLVVRQGFSSSGTHMATLDMSGLADLQASIGQILVGQSTGTPNRPSGTLLLAATNNITLNGTAPQIQVQYSEVNANGGTLSLIELGKVNQLYLDQMNVGGPKGNGSMEFNTTFNAPTLVLRNTDQTSPLTFITVGDDSFASTGNSSSGLLDLSEGRADVLVANVIAGKGNLGSGSGSSTGTINIGAGIFTVTRTMTLGEQVTTAGPTAGNGAVTGNVDVQSNGFFPSGATLSVQGTLILGQTNHVNSGTQPTVTGNVTVESGATLMANSIVSGGGVSSITLNGALWLTNTAGTLALPIGALAPSAATLNLPASDTGAAITVSNLAASAGNTINITSIPGIATYPAALTLINYQTGDTGGGNFTLGSLPGGVTPAYQGQILDTGNGLVQLQLTHGPVAVLSLLWTGANGNSWDTTTQNWLYQGAPDNFFSGAACLFNDSSTVTNINLAQVLTPGSVTVSNSQERYTFTGAGNIAGAALLDKQGTNTLILDNSGVDNFQGRFHFRHLATRRQRHQRRLLRPLRFE